MTNRANVYIIRGKYSAKIADNKIKRGFFCKILVFLVIFSENVTCARFQQVQRVRQEAGRVTFCDNEHLSRYSGKDPYPHRVLE